MSVPDGLRSQSGAANFGTLLPAMLGLPLLGRADEVIE